jgi:hypothetical protein
MFRIVVLIHENQNYILKKQVKQHQVICKDVYNSMHLYAVKKKCSSMVFYINNVYFSYL